MTTPAFYGAASCIQDKSNGRAINARRELSNYPTKALAMAPSAEGYTPVTAAVKRRRMAAARIMSVLSVLSFCAFAVTLVYVELGNAGCWGGAFLMIASIVLVCAPGLVLFVISVWRRPAEALWLVPALVVLAFATGVALQLIPGPTCSGSG
ncbi:hypothetical protein [Lysobacter sp.]|uniref:hypothetical protein n=1 Tax=Lysobacter sp. TaxID=72226 RepID=UPI002D278185|nr:hypothetical protein [Lysobacter sp.]HZX77169.1 hypothetical protein [Lysobacter sp.]